MFLKSRSDWLKLQNNSSPIRIFGRKRFRIHKNEHHFNITSDIQSKSQSPSYSTKSFDRQLNSTYTRTHKLRPNIKSPALNEGFYREKLKEKNEEILLLKELYRDLNNRLMVAGKPENSTFQREKFKEETVKMRDRVFAQPRFTKSKPKLIFTNPITGILPKLI